jgi:hypothetical protein
MTLSMFIAAHRAALDTAINRALYRHDGRGGQGTVPDPPPKRNDEARRQWILSDEALYHWARSEGVKL